MAQPPWRASLEQDLFSIGEEAFGVLMNVQAFSDAFPTS